MWIYGNLCKARRGSRRGILSVRFRSLRLWSVLAGFYTYIWLRSLERVFRRLGVVIRENVFCCCIDICCYVVANLSLVVLLGFYSVLRC